MPAVPNVPHRFARWVMAGACLIPCVAALRSSDAVAANAASPAAPRRAADAPPHKLIDLSRPAPRLPVTDLAIGAVGPTCSAGPPALSRGCAPGGVRVIAAPDNVADEDRIFVGTFDPTGSSCQADAACGPSANDCQRPSCAAGLCGLADNSNGTACSGGAGTCDGAGTCLIPCVSAASCPGQDTLCHTRTCDAGFCGNSDALPGAQCIGGLCDGAGNCNVATSCNNNLDCGVTGNECTVAACGENVCVQTPYAFGTTCTGGTCDGAGTCVPGGACTLNSDCPPSGNECLAPQCSTGACQQVPLPHGATCSVGVCDGSGTCGCTTDDDCSAPATCQSGVCQM